MNAFRAIAVIAVFASALGAVAQQATQPQLKIDSSNRTLSVTANGSVSVEPEVAILHIGFDTQLEDAKSAYSDGARTSNAIIAALKQAGVAESDIHSESQYLDRDFTKPHKFKLSQKWTVKTTPERAAEILDIAVSSGATSSGQIDWAVKDEHGLEAQALDHAAARAKENAEGLAKGMGVRLGALIYASNQLSAPVYPRAVMSSFSVAGQPASAPVAIEPNKVTREAAVYAVFAIE